MNDGGGGLRGLVQALPAYESLWVQGPLDTQIPILTRHRRGRGKKFPFGNTNISDGTHRRKGAADCNLRHKTIAAPLKQRKTGLDVLEIFGTSYLIGLHGKDAYRSSRQTLSIILESLS